MAAAAAAQLTTLAFNTTGGRRTGVDRAGGRTGRVAPPGDDRIFFTCGGSESIEAAWKIAREHYVANGQPQRTKAIARNIAYHGVTLGALAFTGVARYKEPFGPPAIDTTHVTNTNCSAPGPGGGRYDPEHLHHSRRGGGRDHRRRPREVAMIIAKQY